MRRCTIESVDGVCVCYPEALNKMPTQASKNCHDVLVVLRHLSNYSGCAACMAHVAAVVDRLSVAIDDRFEVLPRSELIWQFSVSPRMGLSAD